MKLLPSKKLKILTKKTKRRCFNLFVFYSTAFMIMALLLTATTRLQKPTYARSYSPPRYSERTELYETCLIRNEPYNYNRYNSFPIIFEPDRFQEVNLGGNKVSLSPHAQLVASLTKEQGYEVRCAALPWYITHGLIDERWAKHFYEHYGGVVTFDSCGSYVLSGKDGRVPVYRSDEDCIEHQHKASSYEAFFGSLPPHITPTPRTGGSQEEPGEAFEISRTDPTQAGVANHLLTPAQQCRVKVDNLETIAFYCQELAPAEAWCYLNRPIVNSKYDMLTLYGVLHQYIHSYRDQFGNPLSCNDIMGTWENLEKSKPWAIEDNNLTEERFYDVQTAINNIGFNIENLYRTAFLVISFGQDYWEDESDTSMLVAEAGLEQYEHVPLVFVFKIPDFLTNESRFDDASRVLRRVLTTKEQQDAHHQQAAERRDDLFNKALTRSTGNRFFPGDPIYCPSMPECTPVAGYAWSEIKKEPITGWYLPVTHVKENTIIRNAIIDIINGHHSGVGDCTEIIYEEAGDIYTSAELKIDDRGQFIGKPESAFHPNLEDVVGVSRDFDWRFVARNYEEYEEGFEFDNSPNIPVRAWIVAPLGIEQEQVFEVLQGTFFTKEQQERMLEQNVVVDSGNVRGRYPEYFTFRGVSYGLNFADEECERFVMFKYDDFKFPECHTIQDFVCDEDEETGEKVNCRWIEKEVCTDPEREFGKGIGEDKPPHLNIFGALVGWGIRKIQETIHVAGTPWHDYFASCDRVEDMFLGRCGADRMPSTTDPYRQINKNWKPVLDYEGEPVVISYETEIGTCKGTLMKHLD